MESSQREYIAILGIFAAVVLAFTGGIAFSTSVLNNVAKASIYRTVTVSYDGNSFVLHGKQLLKIFNSTNFTDFGSLRYLYKYIEKSGAIDQMKEMGIEDGDIIKIEDFEFEYYDEDYFED